MVTLAVPTGFEPATSGLTGRRALQAAPRDHMISTPNGIRTRVTALKGRRPRPLDDGGSHDRARSLTPTDASALRPIPMLVG